jgi:hypothetical protein
MSEVQLSDGAKAFLDGHLAKVRERIIEEAAKQSDSSIQPLALEPMALADAAKSFAPGDLVPVSSGRTSIWQRLFDPISGMTLVCALLAVVFGVLGLWAQKNAKADAQSWLDVAKVFAGAVVGSTGAGIVSAKISSSSRTK